MIILHFDNYPSRYRGTDEQVISISHFNNRPEIRVVFLSFKLIVFLSSKIPITCQCKRFVRRKLTCSYSPPLSRAAAILPSKSEELINSFHEEKLTTIMLGYEV